MKRGKYLESTHWTLSVHHTNRYDAYKFACPKCGVDELMDCRYISDKNPIGKRTKRPHVERTYLVQKQIYFEQQDRLKQWLLDFGDILQEG